LRHYFSVPFVLPLGRDTELPPGHLFFPQKFLSDISRATYQSPHLSPPAGDATFPDPQREDLHFGWIAPAFLDGNRAAILLLLLLQLSYSPESYTERRQPACLRFLWKGWCNSYPFNEFSHFFPSGITSQ